MNATVNDVAREAGVAASTVSRVISGHGSASMATRTRVLAAATRLGYRPNPAARGLITGRTGNLGVIVPDLLNPFFAGIVKGIQSRAAAAGNSVFVADTDENPRSERSIALAVAKQVDGLLLCSPRMAPEDMHAVNDAIEHIVLLHRRAEGFHSVSADSAGGMSQIVANLQALGHRRVAHVDGPTTSWSGSERVRGLKQAVIEYDIDLVELGSFLPSFDGGVASCDLVLASGATAVIAYNDQVAMGILRRCHQRGVTVPDDLSIVGFDDIAIAQMSSPPLTTVLNPQAEVGRMGVELLLELFDQPPTSEIRETVLATHLVVRESTGVAPR